MKTLKNWLGGIKAAVVLAAIVMASGAFGQSIGFDTFGPNRRIVFPMTSTALTATTVSTNTTYNPIFVRYFKGVAVCDINDYTNNATNVFTVTPQTSMDNTNWSTPSYALAINYNAILTNNAYGGGTNLAGTNLFATNTMLLPGTPTQTTYTANSGGSYESAFTPYLNPTVFTNTGAITFGAGTNTAEIAWVVSDAGNYFRLVVTNAGTNIFNAVYSGHLTQ